MDDDLVGTMMDAGMTPQDVREAFGSAYATTHDSGAPIEPVVHTLLTVARDQREPPGPQVVVPSGVVHSLPASKDAKAVRVDTEESYRDFRNGGGVDQETLDAPENSQAIPDMLNQLAEGEAGLSDTTDFQRGTASQWLVGAGRKRKHRRSRVGDIMSRGAASTHSLFNDPAFSGDQSCLFCGTPSGGTAACADCLARPEVLGLFERGPASAIYDSHPTSRNVRLSTVLGGMYRMQRTNEESARMIGAEEFYRLQHQLDESAVLGADAEEFYRLQRTNEESATMLGAEEFYRLQHQLDESATLVGDDFYRLQRTDEESARMIGADDPFYRLQWQTEESARLIGADGMYSMARFADEADALTAPQDAPAESIPLSFSQPDASEHVATWKQGDNLYASMRVVGWDGRPRVLTTATPFVEAVGCVVGYAESARIPPSQTLSVLDPLARTLGASRLVPQLAASAPGILRAVHGKVTPLVMATMPVTNHRVR